MSSSPAVDGQLEPLPSIDVSGLDEATATAVRIRQSMGLPFDLDLIRRVATDPTATTEWGTPLLPAEVAEIWARQARTDTIVPVVRQYVDQHVAVSGGLWIDQARGGIVVASFTDDLTQHRLALAELVADDRMVAVVQARYAESALRAFQDRVAADSAWFETIPARLTGVGYEATGNVLAIDVSTANPAIVDLVLARYGLPADAVEVRSDGTGAMLLPYGTVRGVVVLANGDPPGPNELLVDFRSDVPGSCGSEVGIGVAPDGRFEIRCQVGPRTIVIRDFPANGDGTVEVGHGDVVVVADGVVKVRIRIDRPR